VPALALIGIELEDSAAPPAVRRAAATALAIGGPASVPALVQALAIEDRSVREAAANSLGQIGRPAVGATLAALFQPATEHGAIHALEQLPLKTEADSLRRYAREKVDRAVHYHALWAEISLCLGRASKPLS